MWGTQVLLQEKFLKARGETKLGYLISRLCFARCKIPCSVRGNVFKSESGNEAWVPHISLVSREMWDSTAAGSKISTFPPY
jgi:hypothetical protein